MGDAAVTIGTGEQVMFWILAPIAVMASLGLVFARKAVHAALGMALTMIILGVIQIFVYTGAVMMLFLFVIMLIGVDASDSLIETLKGQRWAAGLLVLGLGGILVSAVGSVTYGLSDGVAQTNTSKGNVPAMAELIFGRYVWVFEVTSALLITAALGAMVLAHRERLGKGPNQREWSRRRFEQGENLAGTRSGQERTEAVSISPLRQPDGSISELSVSRVLSAREQTRSPLADLEAEDAIRAEIESGSER